MLKPADILHIRIVLRTLLVLLLVLLPGLDVPVALGADVRVADPLPAGADTSVTLHSSLRSVRKLDPVEVANLARGLVIILQDYSELFKIQFIIIVIISLLY